MKKTENIDDYLKYVNSRLAKGFNDPEEYRQFLIDVKWREVFKNPPRAIKCEDGRITDGKLQSRGKNLYDLYCFGAPLLSELKEICEREHIKSCFPNLTIGGLLE